MIMKRSREKLIKTKVNTFEGCNWLTETLIKSDAQKITDNDEHTTHGNRELYCFTEISQTCLIPFEDDKI